MKTEAASPAEIDATLSDATLKQMAFKPGTCRNICIRITESFLKDRIQWADEVSFGEVSDDDRNCIGMAWRHLSRLGIIKRMEEHRRSKVKSRRGATIWKYRLVNESLAMTFLRRNGWTPAYRGQPELFMT